MEGRLLLAIATVGVIATGCRYGESNPVPADVPGSYVYAAKGSTLGKPWEVSARLELRPDNRFALTLDKTIEGRRDPTETSNGTYSVSGNHILLREGKGPLNSTHDQHKLVMKADSLIAEVGWTVELFLKGVGAPNIVFVRERRS